MATNLFQNSVRHKPAIWLPATAISLALLGYVVVQADFGQARAMLAGMSWTLLAAALFFLMLEGIVTALRIRIFAGNQTCYSPALKANAWYVLLLVILPARLGEVAAILVFERYLGQKYGAAAMSIVAQRLYDVIVLGVFFLISVLGLSSMIDTGLMSIVALALMAVAVFVLLRIEMFLTIAVLLLKKFRLGGLGKKIIRFLLQGRSYARHNLKHRDIPLVLLLTAGKWASNLAALVCLFMAIHLGLSFFENAAIAAAYNFLAAVPLQTIGGIGIGEAGLSLLFAAAGIAMPVAAGASLMIRFVILVFPFIFWVLVMGSLRLKEAVFK